MSNPNSVNLNDFLGGLKDKYGEDLSGYSDSVQGAWSGPPLPLDQQYLVEVVEASFGDSKAGNPQLILVFAVQEPSEFAGRRLREYYAIGGNDVASRKLTELIVNTQTNINDHTGDWNDFAKSFEGKQLVVALRVWGSEQDQYGVRYSNAWKGQELKKVKPAVPKKDTSSLRPEIVVPKEGGAPAPSVPQAAKAPEVPGLPGAGSKPVAEGVRLPPGLAK